MEKIVGKVKIDSISLAKIKKQIKNIPDYQAQIEKYLKYEITQLLEIILGGGINIEASDIHLEIEEKRAKIRTRIDGLLQDVMFIDQKTYAGLLSRIKLLAGIKLNITDTPQNGRFSIVLEGIPIETRVSTLPTEYGESMVLRILDPKNIIEIEALGLRKDLLATFTNEIKKPYGMIIVTGPTGSGKTTSLYAFLKRIQTPEIKIITIEDPIEYHLPGISQTQTAPEKGYDFASGLKSIMRQDPDVVLVGEIRDLETANIAIQAALTGHFVFTTLHTNDAIGTVARLTSLGAKLSNIGPAINMIVAQRLVRRTCPDCTVFKKASAAEFEKIKRVLSGIPKTVEFPDITANTKIPVIQGCRNCNNTGYRRRIGIFEVLLVDDEMERFILTTPSIADLKQYAFKTGMITMYQDGIIKMLQGITTLDEVERTTME